MQLSDIARLRLHAQQVSKHTCKTPQALVSYMGALQAQDFPASKYAIGARLQHTPLQQVDKAINKGEIIRTWIYRGTLQLVTPADIRWMIALVKDRLEMRLKSTEKVLGVDAAIYPRVFKLLKEALHGGNRLMRSEVEALLQKHNIGPEYMRYSLFRASLEGIICHGPMKGKQFTFTLLDEWCPPQPSYSKEKALELLAERYFTSHGPATVADFTTYAGITQKEANIGLEAAKPRLDHITIADTSWWCGKGLLNTKTSVPDALVLPAFDEINVAYKDRSPMIAKEHGHKVMTVNGIFHPIMLNEGQICGLWKRTIAKDGLEISFEPFISLPKSRKNAFETAVQHYAEFMELPIKTLSFV
ncbi:winged helix DNA-binding protein [Chitinophaga dinghuensis]|uniref:Winged helix DNA-binding protein n=1 Tax=Chitinophaga dinghuensis TaxID=1539050 RepID=A0A327VIH5_9BACT|nr:winged helix DNA-binding domain-containing protein [Chitinophaga dinghuensis]RAJ73892.1 winged helix DNA-binding protein [Chitinophaga dinghuensis]